MPQVLRPALLCLLLACWCAAESKPAGPMQIPSIQLNGLVYDLSIVLDHARTKSVAAGQVTEGGNRMSFENGKLMLSIAGFAPLSPIPFTASKVGTLVKLEMAEKNAPVKSTDKKKDAGTISFTGAIGDNGASFIGTLTWNAPGADGKNVKNTFTITGTKAGAKAKDTAKKDGKPKAEPSVTRDCAPRRTPVNGSMFRALSLIGF